MSSARWTTTLRAATGAATLAALLFTAACGSQVTGTAQPGSGAPAVASPTDGEELGSGSQPTGEPGGPVTSPGATSGEVPSGEAPSGESPTSESPTGESPEEADSGTTPATPTSESPEMGGADAVPKSATPSTTAPRPTSQAPATTTAQSAFPWEKNLCVLMPKSAISGLVKEGGNPEVRCMYTTPMGKKGYRSVIVSSGFEAAKDEIDPQLAPKIVDVTIDGRKGLAYLNKDQSIATAAFTVTGSDGDDVGIYVLVSDDSLKGAQLQQKAVAVAAEVSQKLPR